MQRNADTNKADYFAEILDCARSHNQKKINELLEKNYFSLDVLKGTRQGLLTPAGLLEMLGETEAAEFLMRNGADVDYMGYGAALKGQENQLRCELLRKKYGANPNFIAKAAAVVGNIEYAEELHLHHGVDWYDIVIGCVNGGDSRLALHFIENHISSILHANIETGDWLTSESELTPECRERFWELVEVSNPLYGHSAVIHEFWRAVGMAGLEVDEDVKLLSRFLNSNRVELDDGLPCDVYYGRGLVGVALPENADLKLKQAYYKGAIHGNHNDLIPDELYEPEPDYEYIPIDFEPALYGRNLAYIESCIKANKLNPEMMSEIDRWLSYLAVASQDEQVIRHSHLYGFSRLNQFNHFLHGREIRSIGFSFTDLHVKMYKTVSLVYTYLDKTYLRNLGEMEFFRLVPNEKIATQLMAFDANDEFQRELLARFTALNMGASDNRFISRCYYDFEQAYANARKVRTLMHKYHFNYDQALAIVQSKDLRNFILNACRDIAAELTSGISAKIVSKLSGLQLSDASGLIDQIRYYRLFVVDILKIADNLQGYADQHNNEQGQHAASLAQTFKSTRNYATAVDALSCEQELLDQAKQGKGAKFLNNAPSALQSVVGFFGAVGLRAKSYRGTIHNHEQEYTMPVVSDDYHEIVSTSLQMLRAKSIG